MRERELEGGRLSKKLGKTWKRGNALWPDPQAEAASVDVQKVDVKGVKTMLICHPRPSAHGHYGSAKETASWDCTAPSFFIPLVWIRPREITPC